MQRLFAGSIAFLALAGCHGHVDPPSPPSPAPPPAPSACPPPAPSPPCVTVMAQDTAPGDWSETLQGVRGRLVVWHAKTSDGTRQLGIGVEIENLSGTLGPIPIWWTEMADMLDFSLEDDAGKVIPMFGFPGNHMTPLPHWFELESGSTVRFTVSTDAYEYPSSKRVFLRPITFQGWDLTGMAHRKLAIRATFRTQPAKEPRRRAWTGPLALPAVAVPD